MSKIRHWDEATQSWVIDSASNAMNIELSNPGYTDQNGIDRTTWEVMAQSLEIVTE